MTCKKCIHLITVMGMDDFIGVKSTVGTASFECEINIKENVDWETKACGDCATVVMVKLPIPHRIKDYIDLYRYVFRKLDITVPKTKLINQSAFYMNEANEKVLSDFIKNELWKQNKRLGKIWFERSYPWHWVQCSPAISRNVKNGYIALDKKRMFTEKR